MNKIKLTNGKKKRKYLSVGAGIFTICLVLVMAAYGLTNVAGAGRNNTEFSEIQLHQLNEDTDGMVKKYVISQSYEYLSEYAEKYGIEELTEELRSYIAYLIGEELICFEDNPYLLVENSEIRAAFVDKIISELIKKEKIEGIEKNGILINERYTQVIDTMLIEIVKKVCSMCEDLAKHIDFDTLSIHEDEEESSGNATTNSGTAETTEESSSEKKEEVSQQSEEISKETVVQVIKEETYRNAYDYLSEYPDYEDIINSYDHVMEYIDGVTRSEYERQYAQWNTINGRITLSEDGLNTRINELEDSYKEAEKEVNLAMESLYNHMDVQIYEIQKEFNKELLAVLQGMEEQLQTSDKKNQDFITLLSSQMANQMEELENSSNQKLNLAVENSRLELLESTNNLKKEFNEKIEALSAEKNQLIENLDQAMKQLLAEQVDAVKAQLAAASEQLTTSVSQTKQQVTVLSEQMTQQLGELSDESSRKIQTLSDTINQQTEEFNEKIEALSAEQNQLIENLDQAMKQQLTEQVDAVKAQLAATSEQLTTGLSQTKQQVTVLSEQMTQQMSTFSSRLDQTEKRLSNAEGAIAVLQSNNPGSGNKYQLPNGMILQWGTFTVTSNTAYDNVRQTIYMPQSFAGSEYAVTLTPYGENGFPKYAGVLQKNTDSFEVEVHFENAGGGTGTYSWMAIGF